MCESQPRVDGLAVQRKDSEDTLVHPAQRLPRDEPLKALETQSGLPKGQGPLAAETSPA